MSSFKAGEVKIIKGSRIIIFLLAVSLVVNVVLLVVLFQTPERNGSLVENPGEIDTNNVERLKAQLGMIMMIPEQEDPTIIQIDDVEPLKTQSPEFYANAKIGDLVFIYEKKAIIYRPDIRMIVNVESFE